ncbi:MAG TPA: ABC-F family ATP-binding cassette domain-containing protein [Acidimicrobiales bacterium]|jgi:ATPase subunit of ABC transporter with duplicated ATPase domains
MPTAKPSASPSPSTIATLVARGISHDRGGHTVLSDISFTVGPETCLGIVGPNGVGKSTLLQIVAGRLQPDAGSIRIDPPTATIGYLAQEHRAIADETVRELLERATGVAGAETELTDAAAGLGAGGPAADERYAEALARYESLAAGDFEGRMETTLRDLGLGAPMAQHPVATLSGGQEAKVALAAIVLSRFDITLLDEPTNDLDFEGLDRLEWIVRNRRGAMLIVSHDRAFMDGTVTEVLELDEHSRSGQLFGGGWAGYQAERAAARANAEEAFAVYDAQRQDLRQRAQRERQWATTGVAREKKKPRDGDKLLRNARIERTEQLASRARRTERAMHALEVVEKPWEGWDLQFTINQAPRAGAVVARLDEAVVERGSFTLGPLTLEINWADRLALVGPNGSGKTTLVDALLGRLPLTAGRQMLGPSVVVGELGQDRRLLGGEGTVVDALTRSSGLPDAEARSLLAKFGLGAAAAKRSADSLSPGERTRAELAGFVAVGVNFLVLDEPTNHLDLPAIEQLESALAQYDGTLLLVSHDRRLLETVDVSRRLTLPLAPEGS